MYCSSCMAEIQSFCMGKRWLRANLNDSVGSFSKASQSDLLTSSREQRQATKLSRWYVVWHHSIIHMPSPIAFSHVVDKASVSLVGNKLVIQAVLKPASAIPKAALNPTPPAPLKLLIHRW